MAISLRQTSSTAMPEFQIQTFQGEQILPYIPAVARLRIEVFREYPYLYDGSLDYEARYLRTYSDSRESFFVIVFRNQEVIGASTGVPMADAEESGKKPFVDKGYDPDRIFYFGESVLRRPYRGLGLGVRFFQEREAYAQRLGRFDWIAFCAVERPENHPRRPADYVPLDRFWNRRGYAKHPELSTTYVWQDLDETEATPKPMVFWLKQVKPSSAVSKNRKLMPETPDARRSTPR